VDYYIGKPVKMNELAEILGNIEPSIRLGHRRLWTLLFHLRNLFFHLGCDLGLADSILDTSAFMRFIFLENSDHICPVEVESLTAMGSPSLTHSHQLEITISGDLKRSFVFDL
jgi:hypothetical protein